jgi:hypothetical protein
MHNCHYLCVQSLKSDNSMSKVTLVIAVFFLVAASGCSNKEIYNAIQPKYNEAECMELPRSQYDECINRGTETYEEYEKEQSESMKPKGNTL